MAHLTLDDFIKYWDSSQKENSEQFEEIEETRFFARFNISDEKELDETLQLYTGNEFWINLEIETKDSLWECANIKDAREILTYYSIYSDRAKKQKPKLTITIYKQK